MTLKHAKTSSVADGTDATQVQPTDWNADHLFSGGALGSLLYRDSGQANGSSWLDDVAVGQVLVSGGVAAAPAWSASPTLTTLTLTAGSGTQTGKSPISIFTSTTSASNVSTTETDLISYPMPASTLPTNGQKVRITAWFTTAANGNSKTPRIYFGATALSTQNTAVSGVTVKIVAEVTRTGAATQLGTTFWTSTNAEIGFVTSPAETLSGAVTIKATGQSAVASNDITCILLMVEWIP